MFTKLRNKFLILNMSITSLVIIAALAFIYFITYSNIHLEIQKKLDSSSRTIVTIPKDPLSFNIEVDANGKILNINSLMDMPQDVYENAVKIAWGNKESKSVITLDGKQWRYQIAPIKISSIQKNGKKLITEGDRFNIVFLDVTESNKTLFALLTTLFLVGFITLVVIFGVILYFANRSIKPLSEAWEKQKQFVADASHELKTPLSIIKANYDVLMSNQDETIKSQLKWLGYIRVGTDRMAKLINDLLVLAKIEDINLEVKQTSFNLSQEIQNTLLLMEAGAVEKKIGVSYSIEPNIILKSDLEKVKQVVTILFDNAIKYTNENGQIDISLKKSKRHVSFSIKNSGKGISKQDLSKVFDRFYQVDPSRTHESGGYGLGLSIAKTILNRLGGVLQAKSVENEYTIFSFILGL